MASNFRLKARRIWRFCCHGAWLATDASLGVINTSPLSVLGPRGGRSREDRLLLLVGDVSTEGSDGVVVGVQKL